MSSPRLRRLKSDHTAVLALAESLPFLTLEAAQGNPPEKYLFHYRVKGLRLLDDGQIVEADEHRVEVNLTTAYPRQAPQCSIRTPIFHPNFDASVICIGDHWGASESLADLVCRIGQMITYQAYNTKSPLNGIAARWVDENSSLLPLDRLDFYPTEKPQVAESKDARPEIKETSPERRCSNCWVKETLVQLVAIGNDLYCPDCLSVCQDCGNPAPLGQSLCQSCDEKEKAYLGGLENALACCDFDEAIELIEMREDETPNHPAVHRMQQILEAKQSRVKSLSSDLENALSGKRIFQAWRLVSQLEKEGFSGGTLLACRPQIKKRVDGVARVLADLNHGSGLSVRAAGKALEEALGKCTDHPGGLVARQTLLRRRQWLEKRHSQLCEYLPRLLQDSTESAQAASTLKGAVSDLRAVVLELGCEKDGLTAGEKAIAENDKRYFERMHRATNGIGTRVIFWTASASILIAAIAGFGSVPGIPADLVSITTRLDMEKHQIYAMLTCGLSGLLGLILLLCGIRSWLTRRRICRECCLALGYFNREPL